MKNTKYILYVLLAFLVGVVLRFLFSPVINFESDSFTVLISAKNIFENGSYTIPPIALTDYINFQKFTGWGVGYPLLLSVLFAFVGYGESVARWFTVIACSSIIPFVVALGSRLYNRKVGIVAGLLVAVNPVLVCFSGRILTANMGFVFLTYSLVLLLLAALSCSERASFVGFKDMTLSKKRAIFLYLSFFVYGLALCCRDDYLMFAPVFAFLLFSVWVKSRKGGEVIRVVSYCKFFIISLLVTLIGFSPNLYYNYKNFGKLIASSHIEYGAFLSLGYFLTGSGGALGMPGWVIILLTVFVFAFPVISLVFLRIKLKSSSIILMITVLMLLPVVIVCGAFFVSSTGASPRYIIPIVPFVLISSAIIIVIRGVISQGNRILFLVMIVLWHIVMYYPPTFMFKIIPKSLYLTQYSPWYNTHNYQNYPHPVLPNLNWIKNNTSDDAIILSDYDKYHYYFYTKRDVMSRDNIEEVNKNIGLRPIYLVEDHRMLIDPSLIGEWRKLLIDNHLDIKVEATTPMFSPSKGDGELKIYRLIRLAG